jgi:hypothetical protein
VGVVEIPKQLDLSDFVRIRESGVVIRKHMPAIGTGHFIQGPVAALGQNDGISRLNSRQIIGVGLAPGTGNVQVRFV